MNPYLLISILVTLTVAIVTAERMQPSLASEDGTIVKKKLAKYFAITITLSTSISAFLINMVG